MQIKSDGGPARTATTKQNQYLGRLFGKIAPFETQGLFSHAPSPVTHLWQVTA